MVSETLIQHLAPEGQCIDHTPDSAIIIDIASPLKLAASQASAEDVLVQASKQKFVGSLSWPKEDMEREKAIRSFGIDSLVVLEVG